MLMTVFPKLFFEHFLMRKVKDLDRWSLGDRVREGQACWPGECVFFTAGSDEEAHGLFGELQVIQQILFRQHGWAGLWSWPFLIVVRSANG